ncbi:MAG: sugar ABC transporter ATP-binding protein [Desulfobacteraceae bacterium]|jgi:ABC-type sugar transport system ATPase subunit|nr:MAG: sugar ABC transporter ATP-binding protein [Desulfobacteraceae bacterium]
MSNDAGQEKRIPYIRLRNIKKSFGHVIALDGVDLDIYSGEVMALVGDNGAGKSTLIKIISGVLNPDEGELSLNGKTFKHLTPSKAIELGISTVYQDLALVDCRDAASNIFLGREPLKAAFFVDKKRMNRESEELLRRLKVSIPSVTTPVEFLSGGQRQGVAVARSIKLQGRMITFDEPTAAMGVSESARVLKLIRSLGDEGFAVLVISHNLHHVFSIADRICVIRNGRLVKDFRTENTNPDQVVGFITGSNRYSGEYKEENITA